MSRVCLFVMMFFVSITLFGCASEAQKRLEFAYNKVKSGEKAAEYENYGIDKELSRFLAVKWFSEQALNETHGDVNWENRKIRDLYNNYLDIPKGYTQKLYEKLLGDSK